LCLINLAGFIHVSLPLGWLPVKYGLLIFKLPESLIDGPLGSSVLSQLHLPL
jgi:hypothetical protein